MAAIQGAAGAEAERAGMGKIVLASLVGTTIEFYDFYILAPRLRWSSGQCFAQVGARDPVLDAYLTFGTAFFARPVGSFLFGHFGDRVGRKSALVGAMLTMGLATTLIGALPDTRPPAFSRPGCSQRCVSCRAWGLAASGAGRR